VQQRTKLVLYVAGTALLLLSLGYVGSRIAENWYSVRETRIKSVPWLLACIASYAACHLSNGLSWPLALRQLGTHISIRDGLRIGLVAQIGKYLPGNIAHYVGRGALAIEHGVTVQSSGISTIIELASAMSAMVVVATVGLLIDPRPIAWLPEISVSTVLVAMAILAGLIAGWVWLARKGTRPDLLIGPTLCIAASFVLAGLSVYALAAAVGVPTVPLAAAVASFALAWGAGFLVPGAPAGLGVREATLLALLSPMVGTGPAVAIAILHRIISAVVDAIAALVGYAWMASVSLEKK
jgi:uncharacterized membrane protein YbhN (UPF0104 family)